MSNRNTPPASKGRMWQSVLPWKRHGDDLSSLFSNQPTDVRLHDGN